jgi:hypothetical protein
MDLQTNATEPSFNSRGNQTIHGKPLINLITQCCVEYTSPSTGLWYWIWHDHLLSVYIFIENPAVFTQCSQWIIEISLDLFGFFGSSQTHVMSTSKRLPLILFLNNRLCEWAKCLSWAIRGDNSPEFQITK